MADRRQSCQGFVAVRHRVAVVAVVEDREANVVSCRHLLVQPVAVSRSVRHRRPPCSEVPSRSRVVSDRVAGGQRHFPSGSSVWAGIPSFWVLARSGPLRAAAV